MVESAHLKVDQSFCFAFNEPGVMTAPVFPLMTGAMKPGLYIWTPKPGGANGVTDRDHASSVARFFVVKEVSDRIKPTFFPTS